jgi:hypothetical protein
MAGSSEDRYHQLTAKRQFYLDEAEQSALLTIPHICPDNTDVLNRQNEPVILPKPYQSLGARGVRNLTSKLVQALLPVTGSFYRWQINAEILAEIDEAEDATEERDVKTQLQKKLAARERAGMREIEVQGIRAKADQGIRQIIVNGNSLLYLPPSGGMRVFHLNSYVTRRDFMGDLVELVVAEVLDRKTAPANIQAIIAAEDAPTGKPEEEEDRGRVPDKAVHVFTHVVRTTKNSYKVRQEALGKIVEGSKHTFSADDLPWLALRFVAIDGEDYGRGYVEEFRGSLTVLEDLTKALKIAALNAAKVTPVINPNSTITPRKFLKAKNGEPLVGLPDDVLMLQQNKQADMAVAKAERDSLTQELAAAFLMNSSFQRDAERVTAEEIRLLAEELEQSLGGVYSMLTLDFQLKLALRVDNTLVKRGALPPLPKDSVQPTIVTGLAAIGRGQDLQRLQEGLGLVAGMAEVVPELPARLDADNLLERIFIGVGVDTDGLFKSDDQMAEEKQTAQNTALMAKGLEGAAPAAGKAMVEMQQAPGGAAAPPTQQ